MKFSLLYFEMHQPYTKTTASLFSAKPYSPVIKHQNVPASAILTLRSSMPVCLGPGRNEARASYSSSQSLTRRVLIRISVTLSAEIKVNIWTLRKSLKSSLVCHRRDTVSPWWVFLRPGQLAKPVWNYTYGKWLNFCDNTHKNWFIGILWRSNRLFKKSFRFLGILWIGDGSLKNQTFFKGP